MTANGGTKSALRRIAEIRAGLSLIELDQVADILGIGRAQLAALLDTSPRTPQRKAESNGRLGPSASDRLARIRRIHELATHVLGEGDKASRWLTSASRGLGGEIPLEMLDTDVGAERVQQELREIEHRELLIHRSMASANVLAYSFLVVSRSWGSIFSVWE